MRIGEFETIEVLVEDAVATVRLNRPSALNALNARMFDELEQVFAELHSDETVRAVIVTGAGERAFAAGADIRELVETDASSGRAVSSRGQKVFASIEGCSKPVIACINGVALGGGCELAMACTMRVASESAKFGLPEVKLGLIPGYGGTQRMPQLAGRGAALRLMLTGDVIDAAEAKRLGLIDEIVPAADLKAYCADLAQRIASVAPLAVRGVLEATTRKREQTPEDGFHVEQDIFSRLCATADKREGLTAFLEKRAARWQGR